MSSTFEEVKPGDEVFSLSLGEGRIRYCDGVPPYIMRVDFSCGDEL